MNRKKKLIRDLRLELSTVNAELLRLKTRKTIYVSEMERRLDALGGSTRWDPTPGAIVETPALMERNCQVIFYGYDGEPISSRISFPLGGGIVHQFSVMPVFRDLHGFAVLAPLPPPRDPGRKT